MQYEEVLKRLRSLSNPEAVASMKRFGINVKNAYGVSIPNLRKIAKEIVGNHVLSQQLWASDIHEARILASMVEVPEEVSEEQMGNWVKDFDSWDVCDQCCNNLFQKTEFAYQKAVEWSSREEEFVKRAGFVLMAALAIHDKNAGDVEFLEFLPIIKRESSDSRNYVKKAVNWALRQIGKQNLALNRKAVETATEIKEMDPGSSRWIASDAIRELTSKAVQERLSKSCRNTTATPI